MRLRMAACWIPLALFSGCERTSPPPSPPAELREDGADVAPVPAGTEDAQPQAGLTGSAAGLPAKPLPEAECDAQVTALRTWLRELIAEGTPPSFARTLIQVPAVERKANGWWLHDSSLVVADSMILLDGSVVAPTRSIEAHMDDLLAAIRRPRNPPAVLATSTVAWRTIATVAYAICGRGSSTARFVFAGRSELDDLGPQPDEVTYHRVFAGCKQVTDGIQAEFGGSDGDLPPRQAMELFATKIPEGLRACKCAVDMKTVKAVLWERMHRFEGPPAHVAEVKLGEPCGATWCRNPGERVLALPADTLWSEAAQLVLAAAESGKPHVFEVE